ncbi:SDR family NAD(P)-dependent oxidoreductase [Acinetobacter soli]
MPWSMESTEPDRLKEELAETGVKVSCMELDLTRFDTLKQFIDKVSEDVGAPDFLINNATYSTNNDYSNLTAEELDRHYKVNIGILPPTFFLKRFANSLLSKVVAPIFTL